MAGLGKHSAKWVDFKNGTLVSTALKREKEGQSLRSMLVGDVRLKYRKRI